MSNSVHMCFSVCDEHCCVLLCVVFVVKCGWGIDFHHMHRVSISYWIEQHEGNLPLALIDPQTHCTIVCITIDEDCCVNMDLCV